MLCKFDDFLSCPVGVACRHHLGCRGLGVAKKRAQHATRVGMVHSEVTVTVELSICDSLRQHCVSCCEHAVSRGEKNGDFSQACFYNSNNLPTHINEARTRFAWECRAKYPERAIEPRKSI